MVIYDTLSGKKDGLPQSNSKLRVFVCGPTVYDYAHIGNARTYCSFDTIIRYLRSQKLKIYYLQNITDVDDKIIKRAREEKKDPKAIANFYARAYKQDTASLGITSVNKYAKATGFIRQIVKQIQTLVAKGHAYKIDGDGYYFDISTFPEYGKLSKRSAEQAEDSVSRIDESVSKKNKGDFCLWKFEKPGEPSWNTPLGKGRPGWHIEDTAITEYFFGPQYDIHGGGIDLKFPHHEAEIAQQESSSGKKPMVKIWMHIGALLVEGRKMSKSLGNFITIRDFLKKHSPVTFRYLVASHHYRSPIDYSEKLAAQAEGALWNLRQFIGKLRLVRGGEKNKTDIATLLERSSDVFHKAMADDFNTPEALAAVFGAVNAINHEIWNLSQREAETTANWALDRLASLGIELKFPHIPLKIRYLAKQRNLSRTNQQFIQADALRKEVEALGYIVDDTPAGPLILRAD